MFLLQYWLRTPSGRAFRRFAFFEAKTLLAQYLASWSRDGYVAYINRDDDMANHLAARLANTDFELSDSVLDGPIAYLTCSRNHANHNMAWLRLTPEALEKVEAIKQAVYDADKGRSTHAAPTAPPPAPATSEEARQLQDAITSGQQALADYARQRGIDRTLILDREIAAYLLTDVAIAMVGSQQRDAALNATKDIVADLWFGVIRLLPPKEAAS